MIMMMIAGIHISRRKSLFFWCFGINFPDCYGVIDVHSGKSTIFAKEVSTREKVWSFVLDPEDYANKFEIDEAQTSDKLEEFFSKANPSTVYVLEGINSYCGFSPLRPDFDWLTLYNVNTNALYPLINEARVNKSNDEIELLRQAGELASDGHVFVMQNFKPGMNESHVSSQFRLHNGFYSNCDVPYGEIAGSNRNSATQHYHNNDMVVSDGDMMLFDGGARVNHYCSDITTTWPVNGKFTEKQANWYRNVLSASRAVFAKVKPGVHWQDCHNLAEQTICQGLLDMGILQGATCHELCEKRVINAFMPHGLGHYIGIYTHDLKGDPYKEDERKNIKKQYIRISRFLEEGMCLTNEPGCYIIEPMLKILRGDDTLKGYVNWELLAAYKQEISGARVEDNFTVTRDGYENYTSNIPRTVEAIEACMAGQEWKSKN